MRASSGVVPLTVILPAVGRSRSAITRSSVVLPQPDGPIRETKSPSLMSRSMSSSATTGPSAVAKVSDNRRTSITAACVAAAAVPTPAATSFMAATMAQGNITGQAAAWRSAVAAVVVHVGMMWVMVVERLGQRRAGTEQQGGDQAHGAASEIGQGVRDRTRVPGMDDAPLALQMPLSRQSGK